MQWLSSNITKIEALIQQGTAESLTYAALECRLAIEAVCYERFRVSHDYISHDEIRRRWQPRHVIDRLIAEANETAAESFTLSIAKGPGHFHGEGDAETFANLEYVEIGKQVGFDPKLIGTLWNALSSFLHVRLPTSKSDQPAVYGPPDALRSKIIEALGELVRLQEGTLVSSGVGAEISFACRCGMQNKRRASLLKTGSRVSCINPKCDELYKALRLEDGSFEFERVCVEVKCRSCGELGYFPEASVIRIGLNRMITYDCAACGTKNALRWALQQAH